MQMRNCYDYESVTVDTVKYAVSRYPLYYPLLRTLPLSCQSRSCSNEHRARGRCISRVCLFDCRARGAPFPHGADKHQTKRVVRIFELFIELFRVHALSVRHNVDTDRL